MQIKNISFTEALQELASLAGIKLQGLKEENIGPDYSHYYKIMETAHKFFKYNLVQFSISLAFFISICPN